MKKIFIFSIGLLLLASCSDDNSNYAYNDVNEILVELDEVYKVRLEDTELVIRPKISQTLLDKKENLTFMWKHSTSSSVHAAGYGDTLSLADTVALEIKATDKQFTHYLRLNIYDKETGIPYFFETSVKVTKPYMGAWMVLHKQEGETRIGAIEYTDGVGIAENDAYFNNTGEKLKNDPILLGVNSRLTVNYGTTGVGINYYNAFMVITNNIDESGLYFQTEKLSQKDKLSRMLYDDHESGFKVEKTTLYSGDFNGVLCLNDGQLYQGMTAGSRLYKAKTEQLSGEKTVNLTHAIKLGYYSMFYDSKARRLLYYNYYNGNKASGNSTGGYSYWPNSFYELDENKASLLNLPKRTIDADQPIDLNSIPVNQDVKFIGAGYQPNKVTSGINKNVIKCCVLANDNKDEKKSYVYEINMNSINATTSSPKKVLENYYTIVRPNILKDDAKFASSCFYNGLLFFSDGNIIYRLNYSVDGENNHTSVYQHSGGTVKAMKFAHYQSVSADATNLDYSAYGHEVYRSLAIVYDMGGGKSDLVILNLSNIGDLEGSAQVYKEFGDIKDIIFL
ncbi:PKD-like family lipoprotein [Bacteroides sp. 224]|uniref:PKD-like family lipoprotein n=1 Tax=Bacteroides sp. 224 TaxID=2302936 RepID=UPI0013D0AA2E|nr:PKD-like family lipoprotein [Bacteroides sp. 224]NDV65412.1 hypothetical protein [Bacteroides sp. 224]